jgi:hypothetical protein
MNFLKRSIGLFLVLLFLLLPTSPIAEGPSPTVQKKEETVGRVTLESNEYPHDHYKMEADIGEGLKDTGDNALHSINQGMWGFNKTIASFTLYSINQLMTFDLISTIASEAGVMSERIYEIMSGTFLSLFIIFVGGTAAWRYFVHQQVGHAVKAIIGSLAIMVLTFWFYSDATGNIKWLNERGAELEGIASSANVLVSSDEFNSNAAYNPREGIAVLENQLFNLMVKRPYLLLNYGSTKESEVVSEDPNRVDNLLQIKPYSEEGKNQRSDIVSNEVERLDNKQMSPDFSGERFGYLIITIISTIALSIPVLLLGIFKFLLQVWFLALVIFTAIPLVLSLIPSYSESALNHGKKIVGVLLMKAGLVLLIAVITGIVTLLYESVKVTNGVEGYAFVVFLICITMWGLFKYRTEIFEVASSGMIHGQQVVERATTSTFGKMSDTGEKSVKGAKRMVGTAYKNHQHKKLRESFQSGEEGSGPKTSTKSAAMIAGTAKRSASRHAGVPIVHLDDYKSGKGEGISKNPNATNKTQNANREVSGGRNPHSKVSAESRKNGEAQPPKQHTVTKHQTSSYRMPAGRIDSKKEVAAAREPRKHLTKWEAQQQINKRNENPQTATVKRSKEREPRVKESKHQK